VSDPFATFFVELLKRRGSGQKCAFLGLERSRIIFNHIFLPPNVDVGLKNRIRNFQPKIVNGNVLSCAAFLIVIVESCTLNRQLGIGDSKYVVVKIKTPVLICTELVTVGNIPKATHCAKFGIILPKGVVWRAIWKSAQTPPFIASSSECSVACDSGLFYIKLA